MNPIITIELHDTTQEKLKEWGYPEAKLLQFLPRMFETFLLKTCHKEF